MSNVNPQVENLPIHEMLRAGRNGRSPCPICGSSHALSVDIGRNGKPIFFCHANGCDVWKLVREQKVDWKAIARRTATPKRDEAERFHEAFTILRAAKIANAGAPEDYLRARDITISAGLGTMLMPANVSAKVIDKRFPAMVNPIVKGNVLVGAFTTLLSRDGTRRIKGQKRAHGVIKGGYVPLGTIEPDAPLIVAEGVETCLAAMQIGGIAGGVATCGTSGMKSVNLPPSGDVIIAADPGEAGQSAANVLAQRLAARGRRVRIATPKRGSDWNHRLRMAKGEQDELSKLKRMILRAPVIEAPDYSDLTSMSMEEFINADIPALSYLVDPIMLNGHSTMLSAKAGGGKTRLSLSLFYAIATGTDLMDWQVPKAERVLYVDAELAPATMQSWLQRLGPPSENFRLISDQMNFMNDRPRVTLATEEGRKYLMAEINNFDPKIVGLDALMTLIPLEMNEGRVLEDQWPQVERFIARLKRDGRHVLLLHHDNKAGAQYGSMVKTVRFDLMAQLESTPQHNEGDDSTWAFRLSFTKPRHLAPEQARSRIITATAKGDIKWDTTDKDAEAAVGRRKDTARDRKVLELFDSGEYSLKEIAAEVGLSSGSGVIGVLKRHGRRTARE